LRYRLVCVRERELIGNWQLTGATTGGFGSTNAFGGAGQQQAANGTATAPYQATPVLEPPAEEGKPPPASQTAHNFQSITCMPQYKNYSFEASPFPLLALVFLKSDRTRLLS